ncbi:hypothetical protein FRC01_009906, partial [Tulasnella sp. 417]
PAVDLLFPTSSSITGPRRKQNRTVPSSLVVPRPHLLREMLLSASERRDHFQRLPLVVVVVVPLVVTMTQSGSSRNRLWSSGSRPPNLRI